VKAEAKLGDVVISVSANTNYADGVVKVSWAASEPVTELGKLCTVIFGVKETASGNTSVTLENVKFFDENANLLDGQYINGSVNVTQLENTEATLYVVGGALRKDNTAVVQVAVDGAGTVCGGKFTLNYDAEKCKLLEAQVVKQSAAVNPKNAEEATGKLTVSWAGYSPSLDNETILELTFHVTGEDAVELSLTDVALKDMNGKTINATLRNGKIGVRGSVQTPVTEVVNTEEKVVVTATLYDAQFCDEENRTESAWVICAGYVDGKMKTVSVPSSAVTFDQNGIATVTIELNEQLADMTNMQLFTVSGTENMAPLCEKVQINLTGGE
jgi:hypothetical protein